MAEVTKRTSDGTVLSNAKKTASHAFDLLSWQGLTEVLKAAREAGLNDEAYASFRDAVLQYAQSGGDPELKAKIDAVIAHFGTPPSDKVESVTQKTIPPNAPLQSNTPKKSAMGAANEVTQKLEKHAPELTPGGVSGGSSVDGNATEQIRSTDTRSVFGSARTTPTFRGNLSAEAPVTPPQKNPTPDTVVSNGADNTVTRIAPDGAGSDVPENLPIGTPSTVPVSKESNAAATSLKQKEDTVVEKPTVQPTPTDAIPEQKEVTVPAAASAAAVSRTDTPNEKENSGIQTVDDHKRRITEIKHIVNTEVGNPAILIDSGNELGREYMNALLAAMKATGAGMTGKLDVAMARLEKAFELIRTQKLKEPEALSEVVSETKADGVREEQREEAKNVAATTAVVASEKTSQPPVTVPDASDPLGSQHVSSPFVPQSVPKETATPRAAVQQQKSPQTIPSLADTAAGVVDEREDNVVSVDSATEPPVLHTQEPASNTPTSAMKDSVVPPAPSPSIPTNTPDLPTSTPKTPAPQPKWHIETTAAPIPTQARGFGKIQPTVPVPGAEVVPVAVTEPEDLDSPEVTEALRQLLSEWSLFRKSGLFGTGATGEDHPLYKELRSLPMSSIIAGRWERSNQEVVRTVLDYVNAWRHEQGIVYTVSETFEHYLRRVVYRTLKRQKSGEAY